MKKNVALSILSAAVLLTVSSSAFAGPASHVVPVSGQSAVSHEASSVTNYYSLDSYEKTPKEAFYLKQGEELIVSVYNSGFPVTYTVYDANNQVIGTYPTTSTLGRVFKASKDGAISVQFQAGANSSYLKKINFSATFSISK